MYYLRELEEQQKIPRLPVFVDSPMAINVTGLYVNHHEDHDAEFTKLEQTGNHDPLNCHEVHMTRTVEESKKINDVVSPCIIISASGMITGGRIMHHLAKRLPDSRSTVLLVGYQAEGSGGRALLDGAKYLRIHDEEIPVRAQIVEDRAAFRARGAERIAAMAFRLPGAAAADVSGARRAERPQWLARRDREPISLAV